MRLEAEFCLTCPVSWRVLSSAEAAAADCSRSYSYFACCRDDERLGPQLRHCAARDAGGRGSGDDLCRRSGNNTFYYSFHQSNQSSINQSSINQSSPPSHRKSYPSPHLLSTRLLSPQDFICNYVGNQQWVDVLPWHGAKRWAVAEDEPWTVEGVAAGTVKSVGPFSFVRVFKAGHMVRQAWLQPALLTGAETFCTWQPPCCRLYSCSLPLRHVYCCPPQTKTKPCASAALPCRSPPPTCQL